MALTQLAPPYPVFTDKNGDPLDNGYLYFGEVDKNPETNPIQVYYDSRFTQPVAQPIRTSNGYVMRNGSPALIYAGSQFSVTVRDKNSDLVIYSPVGYGIDPGSIAGVVVVQDQTGDGVTTAFGMGASPATENATNVYIDGVYQSKAGYSISGTTLTFSEAPPLYSAIEIVSNQTAIVGGTDAGSVTYNEGGTGAVTRTVKAKLQESVSVNDFGGDGDLAANAGYSTSARMFVKAGEVAKLVCDPTSGDDIQAMSEWISSRGHYVEQGGELYLEIADGLHNVNTYVDVVDQGLLDIRGTAVPDFLDVVSAAFSAASGAITATININASTPLPSRVQAGFAVGGLNIQGNGGADLLNCGMIVKSRVSDTTFTADLFSDGTNLTTFTTPDNTASLGLTPNKLMVPQCTIRAAETGWDGGAREGFMNAERGARIKMKYVGLSYNGVAGDNDMMFATDAGTEISLEDYCVIAGTGEMCVRSFNHANIYTNRSCLGGAHTGANIWQGSGGGTFTAIRTMMGSVTADALSNSSGAEMFITSSVVTGANILVRTTYPDASASITSSRLSRGNLAIVPTEGNIATDSNSSIKNSTTPISITGSNSGIAHGNPTISGNTNATVTAFAIQTTGGVWLPSATKPFDGGWYKVGRFAAVLDFASIAGNSYSDLTFAASGAAFNDFVSFAKSGGALASEGIMYSSFVSAADTVTVRAFNITTGAIDPTAFTGLALVIRAT